MDGSRRRRGVPRGWSEGTTSGRGEGARAREETSTDRVGSGRLRRWVPRGYSAEAQRRGRPSAEARRRGRPPAEAKQRGSTTALGTAALGTPHAGAQVCAIRGNGQTNKEEERSGRESPAPAPQGRRGQRESPRAPRARTRRDWRAPGSRRESRTDSRAEILSVDPDFAMHFKRTTHAVQRCKNQQ